MFYFVGRAEGIPNPIYTTLTGQGLPRVHLHDRDSPSNYRTEPTLSSCR